MNKLATSPAWQVFLILFALPTMLVLLVSLVLGDDYMYIFLLALLALFTIPCLWLLTLTHTLNRSITLEQKWDLQVLTACTPIGLGTVVAHLYLWIRFVETGNFAFFWGSLWAIGVWLVWSIVLVYFLSRILEAAERQQIATFRQYIGTLLLFLFYPIGVWWLQPRVKKVLADTKLS
jgi:hypothetical protein